MNLRDKYEPVIGLEVHAQLKTNTKIFCGCATHFDALPNTNTCPVCLGLPGALPVFNSTVAQKAALAALALNLNINEVSIFSRKNYFYPDLPKGYQISQYDRPFSENGYVEIMTSDRDEHGHPVEWKLKKFRIHRLHLEEDAGKSLHEGFPDTAHYSYVNLNRSGMPLAEIVTEPDFRSSWEAYDYVQYLRRSLLYVDACDGNMEEGSLRCDANVSVRLRGAKEFGTRTEIKNLNSFRFIQKAIDYEIDRQIKALENGEKISQETRLWNDKDSKTYVMRSKEEAHDYRYFPEPDLPPLQIQKTFVEKIRVSLPELPEPRRTRFVNQYALSFDDSALLTNTKAIADYYETTVEYSRNPKLSANWICSELLARTNVEDIEFSPITPKSLGELIKLIEDGTISGKMAKEIFDQMYKTGKSAAELVKETGGGQISDVGQLESAIDEIINANTQQVAGYKAGKETLLAFFVGQTMKVTKGKANPQLVNEILLRKLNG